MTKIGKTEADSITPDKALLKYMRFGGVAISLITSIITLTASGSIWWYTTKRDIIDIKKADEVQSAKIQTVTTELITKIDSVVSGYNKIDEAHDNRIKAVENWKIVMGSISGFDKDDASDLEARMVQRDVDAKEESVTRASQIESKLNTLEAILVRVERKLDNN